MMPRKTEQCVAETVRGLATDIAIKAHREDCEGTLNPFATLAENLSRLVGKKRPTDIARRSDYLVKASGAAEAARRTTKNVVCPALQAAQAYTTAESPEYARRYTEAAYESAMAVALTAVEAAAYAYAALRDLRGEAAAQAVFTPTEGPEKEEASAGTAEAS